MYPFNLINMYIFSCSMAEMSEIKFSQSQAISQSSITVDLSDTKGALWWSSRTLNVGLGKYRKDDPRTIKRINTIGHLL